LDGLGLPRKLDRLKLTPETSGSVYQVVDQLGPFFEVQRVVGLSSLSHRFGVYVPAWDRSSPWHGVDDEIELWDQLARFEAATGGTMWTRSGAVTSDVLLRRSHQAKGARRIARTVEPPPAVGDRPAGAESDLVWSRKPTDHEQSLEFCHHFDVNGAYLAATAGLVLPQGQAEHVNGDRARTYTTGVHSPGWWLVQVEADTFMFVGMPPQITVGEPRWVTTPTLNLLCETLEEVLISEAWIWPDTCRALDPWQRKLRDARALTERDSPAGRAVRQVYQAGIGRLGSALRTRQDDPLHQPTWRQMIIAEARCRLWRKLWKATRSPVAVEVDAAWWFSSHDWSTTAEQLGLNVGAGLGQWKHVGTLPGSEATKILNKRRSVFKNLKAAEQMVSGS
jgi:hypothetical protein